MQAGRQTDRQTPSQSNKPPPNDNKTGPPSHVTVRPAVVRNFVTRPDLPDEGGGGGEEGGKRPEKG